MADVFGLSLVEARRKIGSLAQVARVDSFIETEGEPRGARRLRMINGGGIEVDVHPDRSLNLGQVTLDGIPIAWMEPAGISAAAFYNPNGKEWLRTMGGGLLVTCGLDTFGLPSLDEGKEFGQHGRISAAPARIITTSSENGAVVVEGIMRQSTLYGENLSLRRRISSEIGSDTFRVEDIVTNEGFVDSPHMILYHINPGWPLLEEGAVLTVPSTGIEPRDADSAAALESWNEIMPPEADFRSQVLLHTFDGDGVKEVTLDNHRVGVGLTIRFDLAELPVMYQWRMYAEGSYVLGLEPANCPGVGGRAQTRADGNLPILRPGQSVAYLIEFQLRRLGGHQGATRLAGNVT